MARSIDFTNANGITVELVTATGDLGRRPTPDKDWLADADTSHRHAKAAIQHLRAKHSAIGELYGDAAEHAIAGPVEGILDHIHDMLSAFLSACDALRHQRDELVASNDALVDRVTELVDIACDLLDRLRHNYQRAGKTLPDDIARLAARLEG